MNQVASHHRHFHPPIFGSQLSHHSLTHLFIQLTHSLTGFCRVMHITNRHSVQTIHSLGLWRTSARYVIRFFTHDFPFLSFSRHHPAQRKGLAKNHKKAKNKRISAYRIPSPHLTLPYPGKSFPAFFFSSRT